MRVARRRVGALAIAVAVGLAAGCGGGRRSDSVRVAVSPFLSYGPLFIAADEGLFAAEGLDVELVVLSSNDAVAAVAHGDVDVVANLLSAGVFNAMIRGGRLALVADKGREVDGACVANGLIVRSSLLVDGRPPDLASLRGGTLELRRGVVEEYFVEGLLARAGLSLADMQIRRVPWNAKMEALRAGSIDLTAWSEPNLTRAADLGVGTVLAGAGEAMPGEQWAYLLYGRALLDERREVGIRFMSAYLAAVRAYNLGTTPRNVEILARHTGLEEDIVRRACWMAIRDDGRIDVGGVLDFQRWAVTRGYQDRVVPTEVFWDPSFVEEAGRRPRAARAR